MTETIAESTVETRSAEVADVNFPKRIVTVVAAPYEQPAENVYYHGRYITEVVSRGAFDGIERRTSQIKVLREHSWDKPVGRIVGLHPSRKEGLVAEVKISATDLGNESLELCQDHVLGSSMGFELLRQGGGRGPVYPDAEVWERNRTVRRLNRLRLDHLSLVGNPQYPGASVLDVRSQQEARTGDAAAGCTPNLDRIAYQELKAQYDEMNRRWLR